MTQLDDILEKCSLWAWVFVFVSLSIGLPTSPSSFFDVVFQPPPLNDKLAPILEVEASGEQRLQAASRINALIDVGLPSLDQLLSEVRASASSNHLGLEGTERTNATGTTVERIKKSAEPPRPPPISPPAAPRGISVRGSTIQGGTISGGTLR